MTVRPGSSPLDAAAPRAAGEGLFVDDDLAASLGSLVVAAPGASGPGLDQVQPTSVDLRLGPRAHLLRAGFTPGRGNLEERLAELSTGTLDLTGRGARLERGAVVLVPLDDALALPGDVRARFNPRSSTGRTDVFARVLCPGHARFDEAPEGYAGPLWLEVAPLSFPVRLARGDRLCQARLSRGRASLDEGELRAVHERTPLVFEGERPLPAGEVSFDGAGGLALRVGLAGRTPCGWRATRGAPEVELAREGAHDPSAYFEPVRAERGRALLEPGAFYLFASKERVRVPPELAAEMLPVDVGMGELRNNYAGFFDAGFGWREDAAGRPIGNGTPAVLEVRAHDVPFAIEDGQVLVTLRWFRAARRPRRLYGEGRGASYAEQDLDLARAFRRPRA